jgi:hypothetical protein
MTGKPEVMPPGWRIALDKRACIEWSSPLPGGRRAGSYPETLVLYRMRVLAEE